MALLAICLLLEGCMAKPAGVPTTASSFVCMPADGTGDASDARSVEIDPGTDAGTIMLKIGNGYPQRLDAVFGSANHLFANTAYAWRLAYPAPVMTDIASFQTYRCVAH